MKISDSVASDNKINKLLEVMATLRGENGCPWDKEQTFSSLRRYLLEECYEAAEAIDNNDMPELKGELGDVLLQVVFLSQIGTEQGIFDFDDVVEGITNKMIYRHPHVFGERADIKTATDVLNIWEDLKAKENSLKQDGKKQKSLVEVSKALPALLRSQRIQEKAATVGFDWPDDEGAMDKLVEEINEVKNAQTKAEMQAEFGDVLFSLVNLGRIWGINAEEALSATCEKFIHRFKYIEQKAKQSEEELGEIELKILDMWWEEAKNS